jgi:glycosyltransferase involved in cell wall biosynthesis
MVEKVIAVVPAFNEEGYLSRVLIPLLEAKRSGVIDDVLVVDDGSTDRTGHIAAGFGAQLISHHPNRGKSAAFKSAAEWCRTEGADIIFITDADMLNLSAAKVAKFVGAIRGKRKVGMITSGYFQERLPEAGEEFDLGGWDECGSHTSGFRAVRMSFLHPWFSRNKKWTGALEREGYTIDEALEFLIPESAKRVVTGLDLTSRSPGGSKPLFKIIDDQASVRQYFEKRQIKARELKAHRVVACNAVRLGLSELEEGLQKPKTKRRV